MPYEIKPWIMGGKAIQILKEAMGIPKETLLQRLVIECDCEKVPIVYIKAIGMARLVEAAAGLFRIVPVADVTVAPDGTVDATRHEES